MALPRLSETPWYEVTIPSTGVKTRYRPYLVKEEKVLLIALESQDQIQITKSTADLIVGCLEADINKADLTTYDIEYLFIKIRSKAVGEKIQLSIPCGNCEQNVDFEVNLDDIKLPTINHSADIKLTDQVEVKMRSLSYMEQTENEKLFNPETYAEFVFESVIRSMVEVRTEEDLIIVQEEPDEEITSFLDSLDTKTFNKLRDFVEDVPMIESTIAYKCEHCEEESEARLRGLADFFA